MPTAPKRLGAPASGKPAKYSKPNWKHEPGCYGWDWTKLRNAYKAEHVLCEVCETEGRTTLMDAVHHIVPFASKDDPLRLDWDNLQSVCNSCHSKLQHQGKRHG